MGLKIQTNGPQKAQPNAILEKVFTAITKVAHMSSLLQNSHSWHFIKYVCTIQNNTLAPNPAFVKLIMLSFWWHCLRDVLIRLNGNPVIVLESVSDVLSNSIARGEQNFGTPLLLHPHEVLSSCLASTQMRRGWRACPSSSTGTCGPSSVGSDNVATRRSRALSPASVKACKAHTIFHYNVYLTPLLSILKHEITHWFYTLQHKNKLTETWNLLGWGIPLEWTLYLLLLLSELHYCCIKCRGSALCC